MEKEKEVKEINEQIAHAFQMLLSIPLGVEEEEEYYAMKKQIAHFLIEIAEAGGLEQELEAGINRLKEIVRSPDFASFLKKFNEKDKN